MRKPASTLAALAADRGGASALMTGLGLVVTLGFVGVGIDVGAAYHTRRSAQNAADSAAFSGATALLAGASDVGAQARAVAAGYGFGDGLDGVTVTVNGPPASGAFASDPKAVEVIVQRPGRRFFSSFFTSGPTTIRARAVARAGARGNACVIALDEKAEASALETGSADVNLVGCSLWANSNSPTALELKGGARITADSVGVVGGYAVSNNSTLTTANGVLTGQKPIPDPYADVPEPVANKCDYAGPTTLQGVQTIPNRGPTIFCNGLKINAGADITLEPGVYMIDRGAFTVEGNATLRGSGVTIVLTSSTGSGYASLDFRGGAKVTLSAPTSGWTAGLAIYQDRRAPATGENMINGGTTQSIAGAIYFPKQGVTFSGGAVSTSDCTQLLAGRVTFKGNSRLGINCAGTGVRMAGGTPTKLVE